MINFNKSDEIDALAKGDVELMEGCASKKIKS